LVDTTFAKARRPYQNTWEYYSADKKDHGFWYQVICSLGKPFRFLGFQGPYKGAAAAVSIARDTIIPNLLPNEKIMTDKAYWQEERCWTPPLGDIRTMSVEDKIKRRKVTRIRHLNERLINRLTSWGIFRRRWSKSWRLHALCAHVAARLTQLQVHAFPLS